MNDIVKDEEPTGSVGKRGDDKYDPEERTRAVVGKEFKFDKKSQSEEKIKSQELVLGFSTSGVGPVGLEPTTDGL